MCTSSDRCEYLRRKAERKADYSSNRTKNLKQRQLQLSELHIPELEVTFPVFRECYWPKFRQFISGYTKVDDFNLYKEILVIK